MSTPDDRAPRSPGSDAAADEGALERVADRLVETADAVVGAAGDVADRLIGTARKLRPRRTGSAGRRTAGRRSLPNLFEIHPEARTAPRRSLGLMTIPVAAIRGTAVEGPAQRGRDFLPLPRLRSRNWEGRWQRLRAAQERLAVLPPIDVLQTRAGYWVVDGHNRVAVALRGGQDDIDAVVTHVHLGGEPEPEPGTGSLAASLSDARDLQAAGEGRLTPGSSLRSRRAGSAGPRADGTADGRGRER